MTFFKRFFKRLKESVIRMMELIKKSWEKYHRVIQKTEKQQVRKRIIQASPAIKWDMRRKSQVMDRRPIVSFNKAIGGTRR